MKTILILISLTAVVLIWPVQSKVLGKIYSLDDGNLNDHWKSFKVKHNKLYRNQSHHDKKKQTFIQNLKKINYHNHKYNNGSVSYIVSMNIFGDWVILLIKLI